MIDPRELRIGNYVSANINDIVRNIEIHAITTRGVSEYGGLKEPENPQSTYERKWISVDAINPIPITEDILLNCGFESMECDGERYNPDDEYKNSFTYRLDVGIFYRDLICKPALGWYVFIQNSDLEREWDLRSKDIYFLHELQNLYFAITGQELNVQL